MNRTDLDIDIKQGIGSCLFLWLLIYLWRLLPYSGLFATIAQIVLGLLMIVSILAIIVGFSSVQYESTRQSLSFVLGCSAVLIFSEKYHWRWNDWPDYVGGLVILVITVTLFNKLLEVKKFRRSFEAILITVLMINSLRVIQFL